MKNFMTLIVGLIICVALIFVLLTNPIVIRAKTECPSCGDGGDGGDGGGGGREINKYFVEKGDTLWDISKKPGIYSDPYYWPLLYWETLQGRNFYDPDLIFPDEVLFYRLFGDISTEEKAKAVWFAKNRGPWSLYDGK